MQERLEEKAIDQLFLETDSADFEIKDLYYKIAELKSCRIEDFQQKIKENLKNLQISI